MTPISAAKLLERANLMDSDPEGFWTTGDIHVWAHESRIWAMEKTALAAATGRLEEVGKLPGEWGEKYSGKEPDPSYPDQDLETKTAIALNAGRCVALLCGKDLTAALASTGPSLRERVEEAEAAIRGLASGDYNAERAYSLGVAADLVQAALEGDS